MKDKVDLLLERTKSQHSMCLYPFTHASFSQGGRFNPCCRAEIPVHQTVLNQPNGEIWNGEFFKRIRLQMLNGERPAECRPCWDMERDKVFSYREETFDHSINRTWFNELVSFDEKTGEVHSGIPHLKVYLSNVCNLQCRMCNPEHSTRWQKAYDSSSNLRDWFAKIDFVDQAYDRTGRGAPGYEKVLLKLIRDNASTIQELDFIGGEPFLQKEHYEALESVKGFESGIRLNYSSNLTHMTLGKWNVFDHWPKFREVIFNVSVDGPPGLFEYVRPGLKSEVVEKHVGIMQNKFYDGPQHFEMFGSCTFSAYNVAYAPEIAKYITRMGMLYISSQVDFPYFVSSRILPPEEKQIITQKIEKFLANIEQEMDESLKAHSYWDARRRQQQINNISRYVLNAMNFMNGQDDSQHFPKFLEFDGLLNSEFHGGSILKFHPRWKKYLPQEHLSPWQRVKSRWRNTFVRG